MSDLFHQFNGQMLKIGREMAGFSRKQLAEKVRVSSALITRLESGERNITVELAPQLAKAIDQPVEFLTWKGEDLASSIVFHRSGATIGVRQRTMINALTNYLCRKVSQKLKHGMSVKFKRKMFRIDLCEKRNVAEAANQLRAAWQVPPGPIVNLVNLLESAGVVIVDSDALGSRTDALSLWPIGEEEKYLPIVVRSVNRPGDRQRFSLAHELGHLCLHHVPAKFEDEAHEFSANFLMPRDDIYQSLKNLTLQSAATVKIKWRVSMQSIIVHARRLEAINESRYRRLFSELSQKGYRKVEPVPIPSEPTYLYAAIMGLENQQPSPTSHHLRVVGDE